jgi:hypothetical protein
MSISNYARSIVRNHPGNRHLFLTEVSNILDVTITSGEASAISMINGTSFKEIQADSDSIKRMEVGSGNASNFYIIHQVEFKCRKPRLALNTLIDSLADASACGIAAIVIDSNGLGWLIGWNETDEGTRALYLDEAEGDSARLPLDDGNRTAIKLGCSSGYKDIPLDSTLIAYVENIVNNGGGSAVELPFDQVDSVTADSTVITADSTIYSVDRTI